MTVLTFLLKNWLLVAAGAAVAAFLSLWAYADHLKHKAHQAETRAAVATANNAVSTGQANANADAGKIIERSTIRTETTHIIHEENADAIRKAPGAAAPLDPGLVGTVNRGLCRYSASDDPACAQMRAAPAGVVP